MRVVFERRAFFSATYKCHLCGAQNELVLSSNSSEWVTDGSLDCHACKGRFQISINRDRKQGGNDRIDTETQHCIRNFRVTQTEPGLRLLWEEEWWLYEYMNNLYPLPFEESDRMATTSFYEPVHSFAVSHSQFEPLYGTYCDVPQSPSYGGLFESGPAQRLATSSRPFLDDLSEDDRFEECKDELEEVESF